MAPTLVGSNRENAASTFSSWLPPHSTEMALASSTKSMTGHLLGAAGAIETIACVFAITHGMVPPTINFKEADPDLDLNYTFNEAVKRTVNVAISNTFGFGGHNASVLLKKVDR